jgi:hypothetical protein
VFSKVVGWFSGVIWWFRAMLISKLSAHGPV